MGRKKVYRKDEGEQECVDRDKSESIDNQIKFLKRYGVDASMSSKNQLSDRIDEIISKVKFKQVVIDEFKPSKNHTIHLKEHGMCVKEEKYK